MKKALFCAFILLAGACGFLAGGLFNRSTVQLDQPAGPTHVSAANSEWQTETDPSGMPPGTVAVSSERQQSIGVKVEQVARKPYTHIFRLLGRVVPDETRTYFINATIDGWVTKTYPNTSGSFVKKNETLATFYSPEFLGAEQALIFALGAIDRVRFTGKETEAEKNQIAQFNLNLKQYRDSLRKLGMGDLQIEEIIRTRKFSENVNVTSPADGIILNRNVSMGQRFEKGTELYRIADIGRVWILADAYQSDADAFVPKAIVKVTHPQQMRTFVAQVSTVAPIFDPVTRTLKVRLEADNPGYLLRPEMFVDVELPVTYAPAFMVPADAVINSGLARTVFIDCGNGFFEPREVKAGRHIGGQVEIIEGLEPGERIVTSGTFLIDSESKLQLAAQGMYTTRNKDPVCGAEVSKVKAEKAGRKITFRGKTYYFNSDECKQKFQEDPERYAGKPEQGAAPAQPAAPPKPLETKGHVHGHG